MKETKPSIQKPSNKVIKVRGFPKLPDGKNPIPLGSGIVTALLGEGGVAVVYEIWVERLGIKRAVKLLRPNCTKETQERFETEMKLLAQLRHPHIVDIHNVGEWNDLPYIEMERVDGWSLFQLLKIYDMLPLDVCTAIAVMVARALSFTHNHEYRVNGKTYHGIMHRDMKPANIMIARKGIVKLMDYGIATPTKYSMNGSESTVVGSLNYISPEQMSGKETDERTDIYSLGCVLYEMITGTKTFPQKTMAELVPSKMKNNYKPLSEFKQKIPKRLQNCINKCIKLQKEKRFQSSTILLQELEKIHNQLTPLPPEKSLELFLNNKEQERHTAAVKRQVKRIVIVAMPLILLAAITTYVALNWDKRTDIIRNLIVKVVDLDENGIVTTPEESNSDQNKSISDPEQTENATSDVPNESGTNNNGSEAKTVADKKELENEKRKEEKRQKEEQLKERQKEKELAKKEEKKDNTSSKETFLDSITTYYGTDDLMRVLSKEVRKGNYQTALKVYDKLPSETANSKNALLFKMRALSGAGRSSELASFYKNNNVKDLEFQVSKARNYYNRHQYNQALSVIENNSSTSAELDDKNKLENEALYLRALSYTRKFESDGDESARQKALEAWFNIKYAFRTYQNHEYFQAANEYIRRLSKVQWE